MNIPLTTVIPNESDMEASDSSLLNGASNGFSHSDCLLPGTHVSLTGFRTSLPSSPMELDVSGRPVSARQRRRSRARRSLSHSPVPQFQPIRRSLSTSATSLTSLRSCLKNSPSATSLVIPTPLPELPPRRPSLVSDINVTSVSQVLLAVFWWKEQSLKLDNPNLLCGQFLIMLSSSINCSCTELLQGHYPKYLHQASWSVLRRMGWKFFWDNKYEKLSATALSPMMTVCPSFQATSSSEGRQGRRHGCSISEITHRWACCRNLYHPHFEADKKICSIFRLKFYFFAFRLPSQTANLYNSVVLVNNASCNLQKRKQERIEEYRRELRMFHGMVGICLTYFILFFFFFSCIESTIFSLIHI